MFFSGIMLYLLELGLNCIEASYNRHGVVDVGSCVRHEIEELTLVGDKSIDATSEARREREYRGWVLPAALLGSSMAGLTKYRRYVWRITQSSILGTG